MNEEENKQHANDLGIDLICDGQYTAELEREWGSILGIVPDYYLSMWLINNVTKENITFQSEELVDKLTEDDNNEC